MCDRACVDKLDKRITDLTGEVMSLRASVNTHSEFYLRHQQTLEDAVHAIEALGTFGRFIKWLAGIVGAVAVIWAAISTWRPH